MVGGSWTIPVATLVRLDLWPSSPDLQNQMVGPSLSHIERGSFNRKAEKNLGNRRSSSYFPSSLATVLPPI